MNESYEKNLGGKSVEKSTGLAPDYINKWMVLGYAVKALEDFDPNDSDNSTEKEALDTYFDILENTPLPTYTEYCEDKPDLLKESDPDMVERMDSVTDQWNAGKGKFLSEKNRDDLVAIWEMVSAITKDSI